MYVRVERLNIKFLIFQTKESECIDPCVKLDCDPNARCVLKTDENNTPKCECKPGYKDISNNTIGMEPGTKGTCQDACDNYCENQGVCRKDNKGNPSCHCSGSFTGKHCKEKSAFFYVAGSIATGVVIIIFMVLIVWMICAR